MNIIESLNEQELRSMLSQSSIGITPKVDSAILQAINSHKEQTRKDGEPYLNEHIYPVTSLALDFFGDSVTEEVVCSTLLHDVLEDDPNFTEAELEKVFGNAVTLIVKCLSKPTIKNGLKETEKRMIVNQTYFENLSHSSYETKIIKLLDRVNNLYWARTFDKDFVLIYLNETKNFYLPFAKTVDGNLYKKVKELFDRLEDYAKQNNFIS